MIHISRKRSEERLLVKKIRYANTAKCDQQILALCVRLTRWLTRTMDLHRIIGLNLTELTLTLSSGIFFMALVAFISYQKTKGEVSTKDGYFLAGRGLSAVFIAGSLLLSNLSAEQLIGLNGSAYGFNLSSMAWEVTAAFATVCMAFVFLPRYLAGAFTTLPEFLCDRYDDGVRRMTVVLFMVGYGLVTIPGVLYSGSIAVLQLLHKTMMSLNHIATLAGQLSLRAGEVRRVSTKNYEELLRIAVN